jgi:hypothetical protein
MEIEITVESEFLRVRATGIASLEAATQTFLAVLAAVIEHRARKVLFDGRGLTGEFTAMERFHYVSFMADKLRHSREPLLTRATRFAYVLKPAALTPQRVGETVAQTRGVDLKAFDNLEEALRWLGVTPNHATMTQATMLQGNLDQ